MVYLLKISEEVKPLDGSGPILSFPMTINVTTYLLSPLKKKRSV